MSASAVIAEQRFTDTSLRELARPWVGQLSEGSRLFVDAGEQVPFFVVLALGEQCPGTVFFAPSYWTAEELSAAIASCRATHRLVWSDAASRPVLECLRRSSVPAPAATGPVIFSSGTTGRAKAIQHSWASIAASAKFVPERMKARTWYLTYEPAGYAGLQVAFSALGSEGVLVVPSRSCGFAEHARNIARNAVDAISATPTWWRLLVSGWPQLDRPRLQQATLGGEVVDQATLDLVSSFFRPSHLTHIYATSEVGSPIIVSDRRAGFPAQWLSSPRRVSLRVRDGVLCVRGAGAMSTYADGATACDEAGWFRTGDLVEEREGRCYFVGREDQQINIGGLKVAPEEIEGLLRQDPEIWDCVAYGRHSPISGSIVVAEIMPAFQQGFELVAFKKRLRERLPAHMVPQHIRIVKKLRVAGSGKRDR